MFLELLVKKATDVSQSEKRRTILYKDFGKLDDIGVKFLFLS